MRPTLMKYNPAFLSPDELIRSFVVRHSDLELILETLKENTGNSNQHVLIIGPRGMGKTMLVLRAAASIAGDKELNSRWYPLVFSEESYEVSTAAEFWLRAVFHLGKQEKNETLVQAHDQLRAEKDEKRLYERALACLMDFADRQKKRLLLVVENLNMLLAEQIGSDQSWDLRHTLLNEPRIMLLGTAPSRFDEIDNAGKAMFDLFKIHYLDPLNTQESKLLWEYLIEERIEENKIRPLQILTGGNPRLMAIISSFAVGASFRELMKQLTSMIDEYTTYFKSNIESLPSLERKVFVTLANIWEPAEAARVAREARIDVNKASSLLKRLESRGCVGILKSSGRKKNYQVTERLYNIYHLMRISGSQSDRVRAVVDFMINFYETEELANKISQLTKEALHLEPEERSDHIEAYKEILQAFKGDKVLEKIILSTEPEFLEIPNVKELLTELRSKYQPDLDTFLETIQEFIKNIKEIPPEFMDELLLKNPNNEILWMFKGFFLHVKSQKFDEAEKAYRKAIEIDQNYGWAWAQLVKLQIEQSYNLDQVTETISQFLEKTNRSAKNLNTIAWTIFETDFKPGFSMAEALAKEAVKKDPNSIIQHTYASILGAEGKWETAISVSIDFLKEPQFAKKSPHDIISFFIDAAAAGYAKEGLAVLKNSACAPYMEPLIVGLQMLAGEKYNAPLEVVEVAKDVLKRIQEKKNKSSSL
jgi:tetratricopeptide (TPR) repeat protein